MKQVELGFVPREMPACDHRGAWEYQAMNDGMAVRFCTDCGRTFALVQLPDTRFALIEVAEYGKDAWDALADVAEDVSEMPADAAESGVSDGRDTEGREASLVSGVQAPECAPGDAEAA